MEIKAQTRTLLGKKAKGLRKTGLVPAELFGNGIENMHLSVSAKELNKLYKAAGENTIVTIVAGDKKMPALISEVQKDAISGDFLSVDFHSVRMDEKIKIDIPIEFLGVAPALKSGYVVVKVTKEIEIEALPSKLPHNFEVDLSILENLGQAITVADIKPPKDVRIVTPAEMVIATVTEKNKEVTAAPAPVAAAAPETAETKEVTEEAPKK